MAKKRIEIVTEACESVLHGGQWIDIKTIHNIVQHITRTQLPEGQRFGTDIRLLNSTLKQSDKFETDVEDELVTFARLKPRRRR